MASRPLRGSRARGLRVILLAVSVPVLAGCGTQEELLEQIRADGRPYIESVVPGEGIPGQPVNIRGFGFGGEPGQIMVGDGGPGAMVPATVEVWQEAFVSIRLPDIPVKGQDVPVYLIRKDQAEPPAPGRIRIFAPSSAE